MTEKASNILMSMVIVILGTAAGLLVTLFSTANPRQVDVTIYARKYAYTPAVIRAHKGDTISINLVTRDVTHGFFLEGYDIDAKVKPGDAPEYSTLFLRHPSREVEFRNVDRIVFTADKTGKFRYRCSVTCGYMHPFMQGELIIVPNYGFWGGVGFVVGVAIATLFFVKIQSRKKKEVEQSE